MKVSEVLIQWYNQHERNLPWRRTTDPYHIWLSEIILQQTRVNQGISYYQRILERFPDIEQLAKTPVEDLLLLWQGLGYYSRARNMHKAANYLVNAWNGKFPETVEELKLVPGVGDYTAAAIASFAFNQPAAVLDGNVFRFLSRYFGIDEAIDQTSGKKVFKEMANRILDEINPGKHNQAIMEFGALQCKPISPDCTLCPLIDSCEAYRTQRVGKLPVKLGRTKVKMRYLNYLVFDIRDYTLIRQRTQNDIWALLYEFPCIETTQKIQADELLLHKEWKNLLGETNFELVANTFKIKHILTHQYLHAQFFRVKTNLHFGPEHLKKIKKSELQNYPVPRLIEKYLEQCKW